MITNSAEAIEAMRSRVWQLRTDAAVFEDYGWRRCASNRETARYLREIASELAACVGMLAVEHDELKRASEILDQLAAQSRTDRVPSTGQLEWRAWSTRRLIAGGENGR